MAKEWRGKMRQLGVAPAERSGGGNECLGGEMSGLSRAVLSKEEVERYNSDGFMVPKYKLSTFDVVRLQELTIQMVEENPHLRDKFMTSPHVKNWGSQGLKSPRAHEWLDI